ncbi:gluconate 2-dehydrogenase subunit 3 family protein [Halovenus marina]|uniref:gluconate 2-dehydrogenase subunit 3 family protein n=1 Tax=Halovenus marina TaxID=3396621 RepID=UPI003F577B23
MKLTRRDAIAALAAIGGAGAAGVGYTQLRSDGDDPDASGADETLPSDQRVRETLVAVADVVYPSEVSGVEAFVETFVDSRLEDDAHASGVRSAVAALDERGQSWYDGRVTELDAETRDQLLRESGSDTVEENPGGTPAERIRYYVVNELLLALYASPKGGKLVGLENPQGHPGGTESYQRGPR